MDPQLQNGLHNQAPSSAPQERQGVDGEGKIARVTRILTTTTSNETIPCSTLKHKLELHGVLERAESCLAIQTCTEEFSQAAFLHAIEMPGGKSASRTCGWMK